MKSNNSLLSDISENTGSDREVNKSDNYYLKQIALNTGSEVSGRHFDNFYLREIAENTENSAVLVCGSLYLASDIRFYLDKIGFIKK